MGKIISLISGKGGTGKTTITANLGIALSKAGFKVCLVDADVAMANLSLLLGMHSSPITLHDVLLGEASVDDAIYDGPEGINFVPSGLSLDTYRRVDSERMGELIKSLGDMFDFVLLDAPAGIGKDVLAAIAAANESLLVTMPTSASIADLLKAKIVAQRLGNKPIGIIVNFVRSERGEIKDVDIMKMLELPIYGTIPYDDEVRKSFLQERVSPVIIRVPNSPAAMAIKKTVERLTGVKVGKGISKREVSKSKEMEGKAVKKEGFFSRLFSFFRRK